MIHRRIQLVNADAPTRAKAVADAASTISAGGLVVLPTETVYGVASTAANATSLRAGMGASSGSTSRPFTWHADSAERALETLGITHAAHRRLVRHLAPGPVRFEIAPGISAGPAALGVEDGVVGTAGGVAFRVPDHELARSVLRQVESPVIIERLSFAGTDARTGSLSRLPDPLPGAWVAAFGLALDDGPTRLGVPSTTIALKAGGAYSVISEGAVPAWRIHRVMERKILFVCTGNTCRSPMAESIARFLLGEGKDAQGVRWSVSSAGVAANEGEPSAPEGAAALQKIGVPPAPHRSRSVTREMVQDADAIFAMTRGHASSLSRLSTGSDSKIRTLDPNGDVPDPIGAGQAAYDETARRLLDLIRERLDELRHTGADVHSPSTLEGHA